MTKSILVSIFFVLVINSCFGQFPFKVKAGALGFMQQRDLSGTAFGYGGQLGFEARIFKKISLQVTMSQTHLKSRPENTNIPERYWQFNQRNILLELRYYPRFLNSKSFFGIVGGYYTLWSYYTSTLIHTETEGRTLALIGGYIINVTKRLDIESQFGLGCDLDRQFTKAFDKPWPSNRVGILITYKF